MAIASKTVARAYAVSNLTRPSGVNMGGAHGADCREEIWLEGADDLVIRQILDTIVLFVFADEP